MKKYKTAQRNVLLEFFRENKDKAFSADEIFEIIREKNISKSAIYRNLANMENNKEILKLVSNERNISKYQYMDRQECSGIVHLKCKKCDESMHLTKDLSKEIIQFAKDTFGFRVEKEIPILYGECEKCI